MKRAAFYFGCIDEPGHYFFDHIGRSRGYPAEAVPPELAFPNTWGILMDGGLLKNGRAEDKPDGRVRWTCAGNLWHAFYWWDRSVDSRPGSNSAFYTFGFKPECAVEAFAFACEMFPAVVKRQKFPLELVEPKLPIGDMSKASDSLLAEFAKGAFALGLDDALKMAFPRDQIALGELGVLESTKRAMVHSEAFNRVYLAGFQLGMTKRGPDHAKLR